MTKQQVLETAQEALERIKAMPNGQVRASIRGVVGAVHNLRGVIVFRRHDGRVRMEQWPFDGTGWKRTIEPLPADLEREAGVVLDAL